MPTFKLVIFYKAADCFPFSYNFVVFYMQHGHWRN